MLDAPLSCSSASILKSLNITSFLSIMPRVQQAMIDRVLFSRTGWRRNKGADALNVLSLPSLVAMLYVVNGGLC